MIAKPDPLWSAKATKAPPRSPLFDVYHKAFGSSVKFPSASMMVLGGNLYAFVSRDSCLASCNDAGRHIQQEAWATVAPGHRRAEWVCTEASISPSVCRDQRSVSDHIYKMKRRESCRCALFRPMSDSSNVVAIAQAYDRCAVKLCAFNAHLHGFEPVHLTESGLAIKCQKWPTICHNSRVGIYLKLSVDHAVHIGREHANTVGVVASKVGFN